MFGTALLLRLVFWAAPMHGVSVDLVGIDTVSFLTHLDRASAMRLTDALPHERRSKRRRTQHHYGNFGAWSATLHLPPATDFHPAALVLTGSLPRLVYRENSRPVGTLGAVEARLELFERLSALGVAVDPRSSRVCRVDYCATFSPFPSTREVIAAIGGAELPRRDRAAMNNGVAFYARTAKETAYDKKHEVARAKARLTRRASTDPAVAAELSAILQAEKRLRRGALRLECRINGSKEIARRLKVPEARPELVLTTENAASVVGSFLRALEQRVARPAATEAAVTLSSELGAIRGQRAFALLSLCAVCGSLEAAGSALGIAPEAAARLVALARSAGVAGINLGDPAESSPLALRPISVERTDRFERRLLRTWRRTQLATSADTPNFSLNSAA
jgi:hypothetical protein